MRRMVTPVLRPEKLVNCLVIPLYLVFFWTVTSLLQLEYSCALSGCKTEALFEIFVTGINPDSTTVND